MDVERFLARVAADPRTFAGAVVGRHTLPARPARHAALDPPLHPRLAAALAAQGIDALYSHQAAAITAARAGADTVQVTGTASGKTLGYMLPLLETILHDRAARALCLYPLKALAADQRRQFAELGLGGEARVGVYDGDTSDADRRAARTYAQVLLSNPDMLHLGILPHHGLWYEFLSQLRFIVLDEVHVYRGVFGSHVALVLRRLLRLCERYGSRPTILAASATIGNPAELCAALTGRPDWTTIDDNGAPAGARHLAVWNPRLLDATTGRRASALSAAARLTSALVAAGAPTLTFAFSRNDAELILRGVREHQPNRRGPGRKRRRGRTAAAAAASGGVRVAAYRGGYLPAERRALESQLASGELGALIATVALESGIDIGSLDAVLTVGYPGSLASYWQQAGRAGRRGTDSLALLVCRPAPVDQYLAAHPDLLWAPPVEAARVDPGNLYLLASHLPCAAAEAPLTAADLARFPPEAQEVAPLLVETGVCAEHGGRLMYQGGNYPAGDVNLRTTTNQPWELVLEDSGRVLESDDEQQLWERYYPGAIHLNQGAQYEVRGHDPARRRVLVRPVRVDYATRPLLQIGVVVDRVHEERNFAGLDFCFGDVTVTRQTIGYERRWRGHGDRRDLLPLSSPPREMDTSALWFTPTAELLASLRAAGNDAAGALHGLEHALYSALPLLAGSEARDVQGSGPQPGPGGAPVCYLFDAYPGGIGLAERGWEALDHLWSLAAATTTACPCTTGCPACLQITFCGVANNPLDKAGVVAVFAQIPPPCGAGC